MESVPYRSFLGFYISFFFHEIISKLMILNLPFPQCFYIAHFVFVFCIYSILLKNQWRTSSQLQPTGSFEAQVDAIVSCILYLGNGFNHIKDFLNMKVMLYFSLYIFMSYVHYWLQSVCFITHTSTLIIVFTEINRSEICHIYVKMLDFIIFM